MNYKNIDLKGQTGQVARVKRKLFKDAQGLTLMVSSELNDWLSFLLKRDRKKALIWGSLIRNYRIARESLLSYNKVHREMNFYFPELIKGNIDNQKSNVLALFLGYSRSGHSLVGALLDAHPEAIFSHELNIVKFFKQRRDYEQILKAIKYNSFLYNYYGRDKKDFLYSLPQQFQGKYTALKVAGDKKGNQTTRLLKKNPNLIDFILKDLPSEVRFIHIIRNPFDNIARKSIQTGKSLQKASQSYFSNVDFIETLRTKFPKSFVDIYLEDLISDPYSTLQYLLDFLSLENYQDYLQDCANLIYNKPSYTRYQVTWPEDLQHTINQKLACSDFLKRYAH